MADGTLTVAVGASRSGKTLWVRQQIDGGGYDVVLVWDVEGQYRDGGYTVASRRDLIQTVGNIAKTGAPHGRFAYYGQSLDDFGYWSECAFVLARACHARKLRLAVVAEELADVTTPGKAPQGWGILIRRGLKYGADIFAITQRPSESDKTIMGNASVIHCCGLQRAGDRKYMAAEMDVEAAELQGLDRSRLEYLHKDCRTGETVHGSLKLPKNRA
jgi:hypothetical protein